MIKLAFLLLFISLTFLLKKPAFKLFIFAFPATILFAFFDSAIDPLVRLEFLAMGLFVAFSFFMMGVFTDLDFFVLVLTSMLVSGRVYGYPSILAIAALLFLLRIFVSMATEMGMLANEFGGTNLVRLLFEPLTKRPLHFVLNTFFFLFIFATVYFFAGLLGKPGIGPLLVVLIFVFMRDIFSGKYRKQIMTFVFLFGGYLAVMDPSIIIHQRTLIFFAFVVFMVTYLRAYGLVDTKLSHEVRVSRLKEGMILKGQYQEIDERVVYYPDAITSMRKALEKGMARGLLDFVAVMKDYFATESISGMLTKVEISKLKKWVREDKVASKVLVRTIEPRSVSFISVLLLILLLGYLRIL